jgi:hypothetical protein
LDLDLCGYLLSERRSERERGKHASIRMAREQADEAIVADGKEDEVGVMGVDGGDENHGSGGFSMKSFLWHGGSVWDAWFSCASNQVVQHSAVTRLAAAAGWLTHTDSPCRWRRCF